MPPEPASWPGQEAPTPPASPRPRRPSRPDPEAPPVANHGRAPEGGRGGASSDRGETPKEGASPPRRVRDGGRGPREDGRPSGYGRPGSRPALTAPAPPRSLRPPPRRPHGPPLDPGRAPGPPRPRRAPRAGRRGAGRGEARASGGPPGPRRGVRAPKRGGPPNEGVRRAWGALAPPRLRARRSRRLCSVSRHAGPTGTRTGADAGFGPTTPRGPRSLEGQPETSRARVTPTPSTHEGGLPRPRGPGGRTHASPRRPGPGRPGPRGDASSEGRRRPSVTQTHPKGAYAVRDTLPRARSAPAGRTLKGPRRAP